MYNTLASMGLQGLIGSAYSNPTHMSYQYGMNSYHGQQAMNAQQMNHNYNQQLAQQAKPTWIFNGKTCTVREMADCIWPHSCADKTHFLLKYE